MSLADIQSIQAINKLRDISKNQITGNLLNTNDPNFVNGQLLNGNSAPIVNASYFISGYIPVSYMSMYFASSVRSWNFYDVNYNYLGGEALYGAKSNSTIQVIDYSNTVYMRFSGLITNLSSAFIYKVPVQQLSPLFGKTALILGDSLTGQNHWQSHVRHRLGCYIQSYGVGGTKITDTTGTDTTAMSNDARINAMQSAGDVIVLFGGTNDWVQNVPIGYSTDTTNNTFMGACKVVAQKFANRYPNNKVLFVAPPYQLVPGRLGYADSTGYRNNLGYTIADYGSAMEEIARIMNVPFVSLHKSCGWNSNNISQYLTADPNAYLHPIDGEGGFRVAIAIAKALERLWDIA